MIRPTPEEIDRRRAWLRAIAIEYLAEAGNDQLRVSAIAVLRLLDAREQEAAAQ